MTAPGRVLAVDLGQRRTGLAISDALRLLASPHLTLDKERSTSDRVRRIARLCAELSVTRVLVGLPLHLNGHEGDSARAAREFAQRLGERTGLPVELVDERLTTVTAHERLGEAGVRARDRRGVIDQAAAAVLLQEWLDRAQRSA